MMLSLWLAGCASPRHKAPVEDRGAMQRPAAGAPAPALPASAAAANPPPPGIENQGKPGYYSVRPGDTLARIALDSGQNWRDIARWNGIDNPNLIEVGQVLRVWPPGIEPGAAVPRAVSAAGSAETRPLDARSADPAASAASASATAAPPLPREPDDDINWLWPAAGPVLTPFDETRSKGLAIGGKPGDPVLAAADGRVVYAGSGLRGYGNLVIVKHNNTYLTAYAHNQILLVKEDQVVRRGQKIAEMGSSDADRVQLHFEIRRLGKPVDPARLLPPR
jgi:lipoprotein NlpD